jgi:thiol-disulfide isomerase/thioredoxin
MKNLLSILGIIAISSSAAFAAEKKKDLPDLKLSDFKLGGEVVSGAAVDLANTGGKAVVIEAWGVNCPPCIASLPHIEKIANRNKADTIVIGAESQNSSDEKIKDIVKKFKLSYTITKGGVQAPESVRSGGIPHAYVFDTTGKLIFAGLPSDRDFDSAVRKASKPAAGASTSNLPPKK